MTLKLRFVLALVFVANAFAACSQGKKSQTDALGPLDGLTSDSVAGSSDGSAVLADGGSGGRTSSVDGPAGQADAPGAGLTDAPWMGTADGPAASVDAPARDVPGDADRGARDARDAARGKVDAVRPDANLGRDLAAPQPTLCFGHRTNLSEDPMNCGACGNACEAWCSEGVCAETCQLPLVPIGSGVCVDPRSDPRKCGGSACNAAQVCQEGRCQTMCPLGKILCAGACVVRDMDNKNCGACGNVCPAGTGCASGVCLPCNLILPATLGPASQEGLASVLSADLNGDGKLDLVALGAGISTFLGNGDGTFAVERQIAADMVGALAAGDMNGDGKIDVLAASSTRDAIVVLPGLGDGLFGPARSHAVSAAGKPVLADLNGDGRLDVAILGADNAVKVLLGTTGFDLAPAQSFGLETPVTLMDQGDLDGDGKPDLVVAGASDGRLYALYGVGDGTFKAPQLLQTMAGLSALAVGDLNNDGKSEIVVDVNSEISVLGRSANDYPQGRAGIAVAKAQGPIILADVDGDDYLDVVVGSAPRGANLYVLPSSSYGRVLGLPQTATVGEMDAIALGDFNGDGRLDVARATRSIQRLAIFLGLGQGLMRVVGQQGGGVLDGLIVDDLDNDGLADILGHKSGYKLLSIFTGMFGWDYEQEWTIPVEAGSVLALADLNGDGVKDIAIGSSKAKNICLLISNAEGRHIPGLYQFDTMMDALVLGDWNGDGKIDYAAASRAASDVTVVLGQGGTIYGDATHYPVPSGPGQIFAVDIDGDGKKDLLVAGSGSISYLASQGDGTFAAAKTISSLGTFIQVGDFDENGVVDIAALGFRASAPSRPALGVLLGGAGGAFAPVTLYPYETTAEPSEFSVGDIDGDGHLDLLLPGSLGAGVLYWLGRGDGSFDQATTSRSMGGNVRLTDLDYDGRADVILFDKDGFSVVKSPRECARSQ